MMEIIVVGGGEEDEAADQFLGYIFTFYVNL